MDTTTKDARAALAELVRAKGYTLDAQPTTRARNDWDKKALHFDCKVGANAAGPHYIRPELRTPYSVGSAVPILWAKENPDEFRAAVKGWPRPSQLDMKNMSAQRAPTIHEADIIEQIRKVYRPDVLDVLASLLMDVRGFELGMTFREWWDADGSDTMGEASAPDALEAYEAIERAARFLTRTAGADLERMCELAGEL